MPAYLIVRVEVIDQDAFREYLRVTPAIIERFGGRYIVRGGPVETLEGPEEKRRIVIIEFPSRERAQAFYHCPEYLKARKLRENAATGEMVLVDGL